MLKIAVIDDDIQFLSLYSRMIRKCFDRYHIITEISTYSDGGKFKETSDCSEYDLIFIDIDMPVVTGFNVADFLRKFRHTPDIIFVSAHPYFIQETIKFTPYRFISKSRLTAETNEAIDSYCNRTESKFKFITFELQDGYSITEKMRDVVFFFSNKHDIFYSTGSQADTRCLSRNYSLKGIEDHTAEFGFIRVHKTYIVNFRFVKNINSKFLFMLNDICIPISHGTKNDIQDKFMEFLRSECD